MKIIPLTQGCAAIVDDEDYEELSKYKWYAVPKGRGAHKRFYAATSVRGTGQKYCVRLMHSMVLPVKTDKMFADHISGVTLDNRRSNLTHVAHAQNAQNRKKHDSLEKTESLYRGVCWKSAVNRWIAQISNRGRLYNMGCWFTQEAAALAYNIAAAKYHGEYGRPNELPMSPEEIIAKEAELANQGATPNSMIFHLRRVRRFLTAE